MPGQLDRAFSDELLDAIIAYGGNISGYLGAVNKRLNRLRLQRPRRPGEPDTARDNATIAGLHHRSALN